MPQQKQVLSRSRWVDGWNGESHKRNLKPTELANSSDCDITHDGIVNMAGGQGDHSVVGDNAVTITPGHGLFAFSTDRLIDTLKITTNGNPVGDVDVGKYVGNASDFTDNTTSVGIVLTVTTTYIIITKHLQGDAWGVGQTIYQSTTIDDATASDSGAEVHGATIPVDNGAAETGEDWLAAVDVANSKVDLYDRTYDVWSTRGGIDLGSTGGMKGVFYHVDGGLRVSDGNFGAANINQLRKYYKHSQFKDLTIEGSINSWDSLEPMKPFLDVSTNGGLNIPMPTTGKLTINITSDNGSGAEITAGNVWFLITTLFTDGQESTQPVVMVANVINNERLYIKVGCRLDSIGDYDRNILGWRMYYFDNTWAPKTLDSDLHHLLDIIISDIDGQSPGVIVSGSKNHRAFVNYSPAADYAECPSAAVGAFDDTDFIEFTALPTTDTFESLNGFNVTGFIQLANTNWNRVKYGTSCILNRSVYIGNIWNQVVDYSDNPEIKVYGDNMIRTPVGKGRFDTFVLENSVDVAINDGEKIIDLVPYADRILQFKQRTLYIINAAQEFEFLESTHKYMGIKTPAAVRVTPYGIAWFNNKGLYFYNGQSVSNLLYDEQRRRRITKTFWEGFVVNEEYVSIGFYPHTNQLVLLKSTYDDSGSNYDGDIITYDFNYGSFCRGNSKFTDSTEKTNFVNDWNGDLILIDTDGTGNCKVWNPSGQATTNLYLEFKEEILTNDVQRKKIYSVFLTTKNSGGFAKLYIKKNDSSGYGSFVELGAITDSSNWITQEFTVSDFDDVYSVSLLISDFGTAPSNFEVLSYSIVFMAKDIV